MFERHKLATATHSEKCIVPNRLSLWTQMLFNFFFACKRLVNICHHANIFHNSSRKPSENLKVEDF